MAGEIILVVDDYEANARLCRLILTRKGYQVWTAADASQAIDLLRTLRPALILMDIQLQGIDGLELTERLKADPATASLLIVAFSACTMAGDLERFRAAGCGGHIAKPFDIATLASQIQECLDRSAGAVTPPSAPVW